jgi:hypothetical protein
MLARPANDPGIMLRFRTYFDLLGAEVLVGIIDLTDIVGEIAQHFDGGADVVERAGMAGGLMVGVEGAAYAYVKAAHRPSF